MWWLIRRLTYLSPINLFYGDNVNLPKTSVIQPLQEANPILINHIRRRIAVAKIENWWLAYKRRQINIQNFERILGERIRIWVSK